MLQNGLINKMARFSHPFRRPFCSILRYFGRATKITEFRVGPIELIVASPFRRCLETAALVAKDLQVTRVCIDAQLGELRKSVKRDWAPIS